MGSNSVFRRRVPPNETSYREAVRQIIIGIQGDLTDEQLGERLRCSGATVSNARNKKGNLCGVTLARIGDEFGAESLMPFGALFGGATVPLESRAANDFATIAGLSHLTGEWVERLRDGFRCHSDTAALADKLRPLLAALSAVVEEADRIRAA